MASQNLRRFVDWEEQFVSHDRGSRVVHYYLKDRHGQHCLAVVGTERSLRHMVYVVCDDFLPLAGLDRSMTSAFKWRARREVVDWLSSLLTKTRPSSSEPNHVSGSPKQEVPESPEFGTGKEEENGEAQESGQEDRNWQRHERDVKKQVAGAKGDVVWVGNTWSCRKRLRHFHSFLRNGITISVQDFVYVMTEEKERHIAYVEDMYEDKKMRKKLRVRWFHKTNELACKIPPPAPHLNEVFFTSFPQVLSVECVDGLATVLSPEHFEKCMAMLPANAAVLVHVCSRQFDNNEGIKSFSIQEVKGYWHQKILLSFGLGPPPGGDCSPSYEPGSEDLELDEEEEFELGNVIRRGPRTARSSRRRVGFADRRLGASAGDTSTRVSSPGLAADVGRSVIDGAAAAGGDACNVSSPGDTKPSSSGRWDKREDGGGAQERQPMFQAGDQIEILSQDSGLRGCWFKGTVLRRDAGRLQVRYDELQNEDDSGNLEEWVMAWRIVAPDRLGIRIRGRTTVRPFPFPSPLPPDCCIGQAVDAWWNDGWWEGIVVSKGAGEEVQVYFPGEGDTAVFQSIHLRISKDWVNGLWVDVQSNPSAATAASLSSPATIYGQPPSAEKKSSEVFWQNNLHAFQSPVRLNSPSFSASNLKDRYVQQPHFGYGASLGSDGGCKESHGPDHSSGSEERNAKSLSEEAEDLLHFVANCAASEAEFQKEEAGPQESECEGTKSDIPQQELGISDVLTSLGSPLILSNAGSNLIPSELKWKSARKRMRPGGDPLNARGEHRANHGQPNLNQAKEEDRVVSNDSMREREGSISDGENASREDSEEFPRWRSGERSGESDETSKLKKLRQGHDSSLKPIHGPPIGGVLFGPMPIANLVMSR